MFEVLEYQSADGTPLRYGQLRRNATHAHQGGKALLFVPGLGGSVKHALPFLELFLEQYDVILAPDLRGFGLNPLDRPLPNAKIIPQDLEAFYQQVIAPAQYAQVLLCGISLGGVLSTLLALAHPQRYTKLVLLAPAYKPHPKVFTLAYTVQNTLAFLLLGHRARTQLPYDITAITRNPAILSDPQYTQAPPLILTPGFLLSVRDLCTQAFKRMHTLQLPTFMGIPDQDRVCDPATMQAAFEQLPDTLPHVCHHYPKLFHDVLLEAEHPQLAQDILHWATS